MSKNKFLSFQKTPHSNGQCPLIYCVNNLWGGQLFDKEKTEDPLGRAEEGAKEEVKIEERKRREKEERRDRPVPPSSCPSPSPSVRTQRMHPPLC